MKFKSFVSKVLKPFRAICVFFAGVALRLFLAFAVLFARRFIFAYPTKKGARTVYLGFHKAKAMHFIYNVFQNDCLTSFDGRRKVSLLEVANAIPTIKVVQHKSAEVSVFKFNDNTAYLTIRDWTRLRAAQNDPNKVVIELTLVK